MEGRNFYLYIQSLKCPLWLNDKFHVLLPEWPWPLTFDQKMVVKGWTHRGAYRCIYIQSLKFQGQCFWLKDHFMFCYYRYLWPLPLTLWPENGFYLDYDLSNTSILISIIDHLLILWTWKLSFEQANIIIIPI
jgi:hypothetical protein